MNITIVNPRKPLYDVGTKNLQYLDLADNMSLPPGKFYHGRQGNQFTYNQILAKGQTQISRLDLPWNDNTALFAMFDAGSCYSDVMQNAEIWNLPNAGDALNNQYQLWSQGGISQYMSKGWWPNGPLNEATARAKGQSSGIVNYRLHTGEATENTAWAIPQWPMWGWYYNELMPRIRAKFDARGLPSLTIHDYLTLGWPDVFNLGYNQTRQQNKDAFNTPIGSWPHTEYSAGGQLAETTGISVTVYPGEFTPLETPRTFGTAYRLECYKKLGKQGIIVASSRNEWNPNNFESITFNDGVIYRSDKVSVDPSEAITNSFIGLVHGAGLINWGGNSKANPADVKNIVNIPWGLGSQTTDLWKANGSSGYVSSGFPRYNQNSTNGSFNAVEDMFAWGMALYNKTWQQTIGGTRQFLKHRKRPVGGTWSDWITPDNTGMNELIDAYFDKRGYIYSEYKPTSNLLSMYWLDQTAGGNKQEIEFIHPTNPNLSYNFFAAGNCVHAATINL